MMSRSTAPALADAPTTLCVHVGMLEDIPLRGSRRVVIGDLTIAMFRTTENQVYAIRDECPHKKGPLSEGIVHGAAVTCPLHNWVIDLKSGQPMGADAGKGCVTTYPVEVIDNRLMLHLDAL